MTTTTAAALARLADAAGHASALLFDWRRGHPTAPDAARALSLEAALDRRAIALRAQAVRLLGAEAAAAVARIADASSAVDDALGEVRRIEDRLAIAAAVAALASAALAGDAGGVLTAAAGVRTALKAAA